MKELILLNNQDFFQVGDLFFFLVTFMINLVGLDFLWWNPDSIFNTN